MHLSYFLPSIKGREGGGVDKNEETEEVDGKHDMGSDR